MHGSKIIGARAAKPQPWREEFGDVHRAVCEAATALPERWDGFERLLRVNGNAADAYQPRRKENCCSELDGRKLASKMLPRSLDYNRDTAKWHHQQTGIDMRGEAVFRLWL
jgi:hypothetical protein